MATSGRISFTVRSILDLPEQDAHSMKQASDHHHHQHSAEKYSGSPYRGWIETDRNHYPCEYTTDRNSPSPCSYRVFVPRSSGEDAKKRTASACSLQRRGDPGWELYRILLNYKDQAAGGSQPRACERKDFFFFPLGVSKAMAESLASGCILPSLCSYHLASLPDSFLPFQCCSHPPVCTGGVRIPPQRGRQHAGCHAALRPQPWMPTRFPPRRAAVAQPSAAALIPNRAADTDAFKQR